MAKTRSRKQESQAENQSWKKSETTARWRSGSKPAACWGVLGTGFRSQALAKKLDSSSSLAKTDAIVLLGRAALCHVNNVKRCGELLPVSSSYSYKLISPNLHSLHAHTELFFPSFHLQDMMFSLQYYNPSSRSTCTFFFICLLGHIEKKKANAKLFSMAYPPV